MYLAVALFFITNLFSLYRLSELAMHGVKQANGRLVAQGIGRKTVLRLIMGLDPSYRSMEPSPRSLQASSSLGIPRSIQRLRLGKEE